jgi:hypothetical protein
MELLKPKKHSWFRFIVSVLLIEGLWLFFAMHVSDWTSTVFAVAYIGSFFFALLFATWWNDVDMTKGRDTCPK